MKPEVRDPTDAPPRIAAASSLLGSLGAVLMPKCPLCFTAYFAAFSAFGWSPVIHRWLMNSVLGGSVVLSTGLVAWLGCRRGDHFTPVASGVGAILLLVGRLVLESTALSVVGAVVLSAAAVTNAIACARHKRRTTAEARA